MAQNDLYGPISETETENDFVCYHSSIGHKMTCFVTYIWFDKYNSVLP